LGAFPGLLLSANHHYISPYYELTDKVWKQPSLTSDGEESDGIYLKITDENSVEFFFRNQEWKFEKGSNR